jgi:dynactin complex subunit
MSYLQSEANKDAEITRLKLACEKEFASVQKLDEENARLKAELEEVNNNVKWQQLHEQRRALIAERDTLKAKLELAEKAVEWVKNAHHKYPGCAGNNCTCGSAKNFQNEL